MKMKKLITLSSLILLSVSAFAETTMTRQNGAPIGDNQNSQTAGPWGGVLLQDSHLIEKLAAFDRERVPERVVHARGTGIHGYYENYADLSDLTMAAPFQEKGKNTEVFTRFSAVIHGHQSPETLRDPRGFAVKFYTEQGNWDLVGNNFPIFFIRDAIKFPDMVHSLKPSPYDNVQKASRVFDFFSHVPESTQMLTMLFSDYGTPKSYLNMDGSSVHAYKFVNAKGEMNYVKFTWRTNQGVKNFTYKEASTVQGQDMQPHTTDVYTRIGEKGETATWDLYIQVLSPKDVNNFDFNPLDATKIWPEDKLPLRKVGRMVLNRVPDNFFEETEQAAFAPSNVIPGIEPSEDRLLQGRVFAYADTQRYRLGVNSYRIPINAPKNVAINNHMQHGKLRPTNTQREVNYQPSEYLDLAEDTKYKYSTMPLLGSYQQIPFYKQLNFRQAGDLYRSFTTDEQARLIEVLGGALATSDKELVRINISAFMYNADKDYGTAIAKRSGTNLSKVKARAKALMAEQQALAAEGEKIALKLSKLF
ncbi:catalase [Aliiglaciecola sp. NS0011-25]|uniref:catalase n=1 Tax=Aliiglaciecola sp. NS0011-25 TaxID=3127654 RepID=UPI00310C7312